MELKYIDVETFSQWKELDPEGWKTIVKEIIQAFFSVIDKQQAELNLGYKNKDLKLIQAAAHSMKSSCANVGCMQCYSILKNIETLATDKKIDELMLTEKPLQELLKYSIKELRDFEKNY